MSCLLPNIQCIHYITRLIKQFKITPVYKLKIEYDKGSNHRYITNWVFCKRSLDTSFYWSNRDNYKVF